MALTSRVHRKALQKQFLGPTYRFVPSCSLPPRLVLIPANTELQLEWTSQKPFSKKLFPWCVLVFNKPLNFPNWPGSSVLAPHFLACKHPAASLLLYASQESVGSTKWMNSATLGFEVSLGLLPGGILPLPLVKGNTVSKYSCYLYLLLPFLCTSWSESRLLEYLTKTRVSQISCRDVYIAASCLPSAMRHAGISFHC